METAASLLRGWLSGHPEILLAGMHVVSMTSASICLVAALLTGWRLIGARRAKVQEEKN